MNTTAADLVAVARQRIGEISAAQLHAQTNTDCVLIDVREPAEFAAGHLQGAINVPRGVLEFQMDARAEKSRALVVYCLSGGRSALAADSLQQLGFTQVQSLAGGINAWREAGLPITTD
jgi:rhodanese-related sulfurtransferase